MVQMIGSTSIDVFALYCFTWDKWRDAEGQVEKHGADSKFKQHFQHAR